MKSNILIRSICLGFALLWLGHAAQAQGGNTCAIADDSANLVTIPLDLTDTVCEITNEYNEDSFLYNYTLHTNYTNGPDYVYAFRPPASGMTDIGVSVSQPGLGSIFGFGVFLFHGSIERGGNSLAGRIGEDSVKHLKVLVDSMKTYYLLIDLKDSANECISYSIDISAPSVTSVPTRQDCEGALPICRTQYVEPFSLAGSGRFPGEIDTISTSQCLRAGELNSMWYSIEIYHPGKLHFSIIPSDSTDDYDFALYNVTYHQCASIDSIDTMLTACSYANTKGITGLLMDSTELAPSQDLSGSRFCPAPEVKAGEKYMLVISKKYYFEEDAILFNDTGFTLSFDSSTAILYEAGSPRMADVVGALNTSESCDEGIFYVAFDRNVLINTVQPSDFEIESGVHGMYKPVSVDPFVNAEGAQYCRYYRVVYRPALADAEPLQLQLKDHVTGPCGSVSEEHSRGVFFAYSDSVKVEIDSMNEDGTLRICASAVSDDGVYHWSVNGMPLTEEGTNTQCINIIAGGRYSVAIKNDDNCRVIARPVYINR